VKNKKESEYSQNSNKSEKNRNIQMKESSGPSYLVLSFKKILENTVNKKYSQKNAINSRKVRRERKRNRTKISRKF